MKTQNLAGALLADDLAGNRSAGDHRAADGKAVVAANHEHVAEGDRFAGGTGQLLDLDHIGRGDPVLLPAGLDDCEHDVASSLPVRPPKIGVNPRNFKKNQTARQYGRASWPAL